METYVVHVTKQCNMDCVYCYEKDKTSTYSWEEIKDFIDNIIKYRTSDEFTIEFLGGDPMMAWEYIQKSYEYIEIEKPEVNVISYVITTNGTILPEAVLDYLSKNKKFVYAISMDGTKTANQLRVMKDGHKNSYDIVVNNINKLQVHNVRYSVHIVCHLYNVHLLYNSICHLYAIGVRHIGVGTIESTMIIDDQYCDRFIEELKKVSLDIKCGVLKYLNIDLFQNLKSYDDVRSYIYDETGKTIGETYGRSGEDITHKSEYPVNRCTAKNTISDMIYYIRKTVYDYHNNNA